MRDGLMFQLTTQQQHNKYPIRLILCFNMKPEQTRRGCSMFCSPFTTKINSQLLFCVLFGQTVFIFIGFKHKIPSGSHVCSHSISFRLVFSINTKSMLFSIPHFAGYKRTRKALNKNNEPNPYSILHWHKQQHFCVTKLNQLFSQATPDQRDSDVAFRLCENVVLYCSMTDVWYAIKGQLFSEQTILFADFTVFAGSARRYRRMSTQS